MPALVPVFNPAALGLTSGRVIGFNGTTFTNTLATFASSGNLLTITGGVAADVPLLIQGAASQTSPVLELETPSGAAPKLFFDHDRTTNPSIRWRDHSGSEGLQFYTVNSLGAATKIAQFQDNGSCKFGNVATLGDMIIGDYFIRRSSGQQISLGEVGSGDLYHLDARGNNVNMLLASMKSDTTNSRNVWKIDTTWATATDASRKARTIFNIYDTAAREALRLEASGTAAMIGFLGAAAIVRPTVTGSRGGNAALASVLTGLSNLGLIVDSSTV